MSHPSLMCHITDYYPISQFQELAKKVTSKSRKNARHYEKPKISPREEIYKSMLREIKSKDLSNLNSLVHKASGILRLTHYNDENKNRKATVSWGLDGRRIMSYEHEPNGTVVGKRPMKSNKHPDRPDPDGKSFRNRSGLLQILHEPTDRVRLHSEDSSKSLNSVDEEYEYDSTNTRNSTNANTDAEDSASRKELRSKPWQEYFSTGDVTTLWESPETAGDMPISISDPHNSSRASTASLITESSTKPAWKNFSKKPSVTNQLIESWERAGTMWSNSYPPTIYSSFSTPNTKSKTQSASNTTPNIKRNNAVQKNSANDNSSEEKVDRVRHICVVNGSVVSFKDFGFENFTNWFGEDDGSALEANQRRVQPKFHLELDLTNVENKDIKMRLLDGYKLEVEARRYLPGAQKHLHVKEVLLLPKGYKAEDLFMCRTKTGKLIIENLTKEPIAASTASAPQVSRKSWTKSERPQKMKWRV